MKIEKRFYEERNNQVLNIYLDVEQKPNQKYNPSDIEDKSRYLEKIIKEREIFIATLKEVEWIKTLFQNYYEKSLEINYTNHDIYFKINYQNGFLNYYHYSIINPALKRFYLTMDDDDLEVDSDQNMEDKIIDHLNKIKKLKNVTPYKLNEDEINLVSSYQLFYQKTPDFSSSLTVKEMQAMVYILQNYGINLKLWGRKIEFLNDKDVESAWLTYGLYNLKSFSKDLLENLQNNLSLKNLNKIKVLSNYLLPLINDLAEDEKVDFLSNLAKAIYLKNNWSNGYQNFVQAKNEDYPKMLKELKKVTKKVKG